MKHLLYRILQLTVRLAFFFYFKSVRIYGMHQVEWERPMLLLPNHQNALIDPLILAVYAPKKTYFLTRSDVFVNAATRSFFDFLRMLPIYRMRDGRENLSRNREVFDRCGELLAASESILIFPEANHNLQRRVRPLSKGFTRILGHALEQHPTLGVLLVPIGVNYMAAENFPDRATFYFGDPLEVTGRGHNETERERAMRLRAYIADQLKGLTTHVPADTDYEQAIRFLNSEGVNYLNPSKANAMLRQLKDPVAEQQKNHFKSIGLQLWRWLFEALNFPALIIWRVLVKPRVDEPEFLSTHRFLYSLLFYPIAYMVAIWLLACWLGMPWGLLLAGGHLLSNLVYVKFWQRPNPAN